jgi:two-component system nitrogen regulation response regulator GlnG
VAINCAAIPETLLESELFGHEKGAFTGAERQRVGKFEQADGGTVFLDEIGDMTPATQAKVLRLLQEQCFERVGGNQTIRTDVRVIAATNQDLEEMVQAGRFRRDLFYRLKVFTLHLPPLRERREDVPLLVDAFLSQAGREMGKPVRLVSPEALAALQSHDWPGNVRELQSAIRYALVHTAGDVLTVDALPAEFRGGPAQKTEDRGQRTEDRRQTGEGGDSERPGGELAVGRLVADLLEAGDPEVYRKVCQAVDRVVLEAVLRRTGGNQVLASELLGISRTTLRGKLRALGLSVEKQLHADPDPGG